MAVGAVQASPRRLGGIPDFGRGVAAQPIPGPRRDAYIPAPKPVAPAPPQSELGKLGEKAWVGTLGVGAGGLGYFLSRTMMSFVRDLGPLTFKNLIKGNLVGGLVAGLPFTLVGDSFGYRNGEVSAKRYWGNVVSGAVSFGVWGAGAMLGAALLPFGGFFGVAAGLALGGLASSLFDKTLGRKLSDAIATAIPAGAAKTGADWVVRNITNPIDKFIIGPVKRNWQLFLATGGIAGIYFALKGGEGKTALKGLGAMGLSVVPQMFGDAALSEELPQKPVEGVDLAPPEGKVFNPEDGHVIDIPPMDDEALREEATRLDPGHASRPSK